MMNRYLGLIVLVTLVAAPAAAQKVYVDYSPLADFESYKTFAWGPTPQVSVYDNNPLNHSRIKNGIEYYLIKGGMMEDTEDPDLYVTYYGETNSEFSVNTAAVGYGFASDWTWDPFWGNAAGTMTTTPVEHKAGTLVIDIWDSKTMKLVWRGTMEGTLTDNLQKGAKMIDKGIQKMIKKWQKMYAKDQAK
jgi:hypothetical protein